MKKTFSIVFCALILALFVMVCAKFCEKAADFLNKDDAQNVWSARTQYPFSEETKESSDKNVSESSLVNKIENKVTFLKDGIEAYIKENSYYYQTAVLLSKHIDRLCGFNCTTSASAGSNSTKDATDIILGLDNGYFSYVLDDADVEDAAERIAQFGESVISRGINFLYFETLYKLDDSYPGYEKYNSVYPDHFEEKTLQIRNILENRSIKVVNINDYFPELSEQKRLSLFFKTDHHWLPQTGVRACAALGDALNDECGYNIDTSIFDLENYEIQTPVKFLGSQGRRVTEVYADTEYMPLVLPLYNTDLRVFIPGVTDLSEGTIQQTLFDYSVLEIDNQYSNRAYTFYGYGDRAYIKVHNNMVNDGSHLLIIKKSFADCMIPYIAAVVEDLDVIDLRKFDGSIQTFIDKEKPDTVVIIYGTASFESQSDKNPEFDFR